MDSNSQEIQRLVKDIKSGKCVLILGPEIFSFNNQPLQAYVRKELMENYSEQIAAYHERDGFFMLTSPEFKTEIQDELKFLYEKITPDWELLQKIAEIPFSLVLSVNPDTWLRDKAFQLGLPNRFTWFNPELEEELNIPSPLFSTDEELRGRVPLYYNLCGCTEVPSSFILDYDDLFRLLEGMLGAPGLPAKLLARLKITTSYLFLGFQFDRWHTQILLRLLDVKNAARRFALNSRLPEGEDNEAFILKHYRIRFLGDDEQLIQNLYDKFRKENLLRPAMSNGAVPERQIIIKCIQQGDLDGAIRHLLKACAHGNLKDDAIMTQSNFASLKREKYMMSHSDYDIKRNRIVDSMLQLIKNL